MEFRSISRFDTSVGGLTLSHHFLEISSRLPSRNVYGLGEHIRSHFFHDLKYETWSFFSTIQDEGNMPSIHPMYMCMESDGRAHGVLLLNSNAMEVKLLPMPAVTFRTIGGVLDFYIFLGPTPEDVIKQYTEAVGRPMMPPYWSFGLFLGYHTSQSLNDIEHSLQNWHTKSIPFEALGTNAKMIDHYAADSKNTFLLTKLASDLHQKGQKLILNLQPHIKVIKSVNRGSAYHIGLQNDVFVMDKWELKPLHGKIGMHEVVYPDFGSSVAEQWWVDILRNTYLDIPFDGILLSHNEPYSEIDGTINGCLSDDLNRPYYIPANDRPLYSRTLCMDAKLHWKNSIYAHYNLHNLYGHIMTMATDNALTYIVGDERKLLLSQSTYVGSGHYTGHCIKGIKATWENLKVSIAAVMDFSLFGIPFTGIDICDDAVNACPDEDLHLRWIQLSMFFPFSRIQIPAVKSDYNKYFSKEFIHSVQRSLMQRYMLLPYLYTLFHFANIQGSTVIRPLFHEFFHDNVTYTIDEQFMWGSALLISPYLEKAEQYFKFYLPYGFWYDFYTGEPIQSRGEWLKKTNIFYHNNYFSPLLHVRAGNIIPLQQPSNITDLSRLNSMKLLVALNYELEAEGVLYWDDGKTKDSILRREYIIVNFTATKNKLIVNGMLGSKVFRSNFYTAYIQELHIMGLVSSPTRITIDQSYILTNKQKSWRSSNKVLELKYILIPLERKTEIRWYF